MDAGQSFDLEEKEKSAEPRLALQKRDAILDAFGEQGKRNTKQTLLYREVVEKHLFELDEENFVTARTQAVEIEKILRKGRTHAR